MKKTIALLALALLVCGSLSAQTKTKNPKKKSESKNEVELNKTVKYRLVISFISKASGIDHKAHEKIKEFIEKHPKKPAFETFHWGREGEIDYCLQLKELSTKEQTVFIEDIKKLIDDKEMVLVYENHNYVKKGK